LVVKALSDTLRNEDYDHDRLLKINVYLITIENLSNFSIIFNMAVPHEQNENYTEYPFDVNRTLGTILLTND